MKRLLLLLVLALPLSRAAGAQEVTGLSGWDLFLDPGHGGSNQNVGIFGYSEADKVLAVGLHLRDLLLRHTDIDTVYMSRTRDVDVSLSQRVDLANTVGAAHFHSIHSNAAAPSANHVFVLWPQYPDGSEAVPHGGRRMAEIMAADLGQAMRIRSVGGIGECDFYGASNCRSRAAAPKGSRNYVQSFTVMPSELSEAGFHTNPVQNQLNMNADWKRLEAKAMYWSVLDYHGVPRPPERIVTGIVRDIESGLPINGAVVSVADTSYTTDTYASLFHRYSNDPGELRNGFYYLDRLPGGPLAVTAEAEGYASFTGTVTPVDTFFTFYDVALVSTVAPTVAAASPSERPDDFRIVDPIIVDFSRRMDRASVERAFSLAPAVGGTFTWDRNDTRLIFRPDTLLPLTDYTLTISGEAVGRYGHTFDGDGDGTGGDGYTLRFRTGFPDTQAPRLVDSYPYPNTRGVELQPVVSVVYDEPIDPASLEGRVQLLRRADADPVPGRVAHYVVRGRSVVTFFPEATLLPEVPYELAIAPGVRDPFGNAETTQKHVRFTTGVLRAVPTRLDDFERDLERTWWAPQQSGSTAGIVTDSTGRRADTTVVNLLTGSRSSLRLDYGWNATAQSWLIREFLDNSSTPYGVSFDTSYALQVYVFGDGSGNRFRFAVDDNVGASGAGHEVSPWYTIDWRGWRLVSWDLGSDPVGSWIGNGRLEGRLRFDSIQLTHAPGASAFGTLYFDDLRLVREERASTAAEDLADLPDRVVLHPNYPNPFNPQTTIRFDLAAPARVTLTVYNVLGSEVATLARETSFTAGSHTLAWDASGLPSGVYLCRLEADGARHSIKMLLLK